jgi:hypothetical protein
VFENVKMSITALHFSNRDGPLLALGPGTAEAGDAQIKGALKITNLTRPALHQHCKA